MSTFLANDLLLHPLDDGRCWETRSVVRFQCDNGVVVEVPVGEITDFASIPRAFWRLFPPHGKYSPAAIVHDYLYRTGTVSRKRADAVFHEAMLAKHVPKWQAWTMWSAVRSFGWVAWNGHRKREVQRVGGVQVGCLAVLLLCLTACHSITYEEGPVRFKRSSPPWADLQIDKLIISIAPDGTRTATLEGYKSDQARGMQLMIEKAFEMGAKSATPVP